MSATCISNHVTLAYDLLDPKIIMRAYEIWQSLLKYSVIMGQIITAADLGRGDESCDETRRTVMLESESLFCSKV